MSTRIKGGWVLAATVMVGLPIAAQARGDFPDSYVTVSGGVVNVGDKQPGYYYSGYDYYGDYYYYDDYYSSSATGGSFGASARWQLAPHLIIDADYGHDQATIDDLDLTRQEIQVGAGFLGDIGVRSSWYAEAVYAHVQFDTSSAGLCGGDCPTERHDGVGVKGGFVWPFAERWYATLGGGYIWMNSEAGFDGVAEGLLNGAVGYRVSSNLSVGVRTDVEAYVDRNDTRYETDFSSARAFVSYHF